jgi:transporter
MSGRWERWMMSGLFCAVMSSLVFSVMNALVKAVSVHVPSNEIVFFRSAVGTVLILLLMRLQGVRPSKIGIPLLMLRGSLGALYMLAYFYTIAYMPLVDAIILVNLSPVFSFIFAAIFLREKLPGRMGFILPLIFAGAMLTINPLGYSTYSAVALFGIGAAALSGAAGVCIRYLSRSFHAYEIILYFMVAATLISIPLMWRDFVIPDSWDLFLLVAMGVVSLLAQVFLTKAFTHENVVIVEIVRYIGILFNAFWGFAIWAEIPTWNVVAGGVLIVCGCVLLSQSAAKNCAA